MGKSSFLAAAALVATAAGCSTSSEPGGTTHVPPPPPPPDGGGAADTGGGGAADAAGGAPDASAAAPADAGGEAAAPSCAADPYACPAGQTCAALDQAGAFGCLKSGTAKKGEPCASYLAKATCADGLICFAPSDPKSGTCAPFCDDAHACASGEECTNLIYGTGTTGVPACIVPPSDAGAEAGAPGDAAAD